MTGLKRLSVAAIPRSLEKAERYRLLNQPWAAESICLDVIAADAGNQRALHTLLLALTDQFGAESAELVKRGKEVLAKLTSEYDRAYYGGVVAERAAVAKLKARVPGAGFIAWELLQDAMELYEKAETLRPQGNDDALLRWNCCQRLLALHPEIRENPLEHIGEVIGE
jgi:hypothetical protein